MRNLRNGALSRKTFQYLILMTSSVMSLMMSWMTSYISLESYIRGGIRCPWYTTQHDFTEYTLIGSETVH